MNDREIQLESILQRICDRTGITPAMIKGKIQKSEIIEARRIFCHVCIRRYKFTSIETGKHINRDHATVLYHANKVDGFVSIDKKFRAKFDMITVDLKAESNINNLDLLKLYRKKTFDILQDITKKVQELEDEIKLNSITQNQ